MPSSEFENLTFILKNLRRNTKNFIRYRYNDQKLEMSFHDFYEEWWLACRRLTTLRDLHNIETVAVIGETGLHWLLLDLASLACGVVLLAVPEGATVAQQRELINNHKPDAVLLIGPNAGGALGDYPALTFGIAAGGQLPRFEDVALSRVPGFKDSGKPYYTIAFTSGTQSRNKMLRIPYPALKVSSSRRSPPNRWRHPGKSLIWMSFSHYIQRFLVLRALAMSTDIVLSSPLHCIRDLQQERPNEVVGAPALFHSLAECVQAKIEQVSFARRRALALYNSLHVNRLSHRNPLRAIWDLLIFRDLVGIYGGAADSFFSSGASVNLTSLKILDCVGLQVLCSYGISEIGPISADSPATFRLGSVGRPARNVKISDNGEILVGLDELVRDRGNLVIDAEQYIHTGDTGHMVDGYLFVTGRMDDIIVMASGKNIWPREIEERLLNEASIADAIVFTRDNRRLSAILVGRSPDRGEEHFQQAIARVNRQTSADQQVKDFCVAEPFSAASGTLTTTLKVRRGAIIDLYSGATYIRVQN